MPEPKLIQINLVAAKKLVRLLGKMEEKVCLGCQGRFHEESCPAREAFQLRNYLTQRVNNPNIKFGS